MTAPEVTVPASRSGRRSVDQLLGGSPLLRGLPPLVLLLVVLAVPNLGSDYWTDVSTKILLYVVLGLGLNVVVGYAGLLDLGYSAFFAIGGYTSALLVSKYEWSWWATIPVAMAVAAVGGFLIGYPTLRLRSDYLAIVTLGFGEIVRVTANNLTFTGGPDGVIVAVRPEIGAYVLNSSRSMYYLALALVLIVLLLTTNLASSRLGRAWESVREDERVAEAVGIASIKVKAQAYIMGGVFAGVGGAFFSTYVGIVNPTSFTFLTSIMILLVVLIGGRGSVKGVFLGALVVQGLPEILRGVGDQYRIFGFAVALIVLMFVRPRGLLPRGSRHDSRLSAAGKGVEPELPQTAGDQSAPILVVRNLVQRFGGLRAVDDVSFEVRRGQVFGVIGPNGAGKTSIFNCVTGVIPPTSGEVLVEGKSVRGLRPHQVVRRGLGRTFQGTRLFRDMSVAENVLVGMDSELGNGLFASLLHVPTQRREEVRARGAARFWLDFVGLSGQADRPAGELSYGDQRRLDIARALAGNPRVLLLDEPAAGMNPSEKGDLMALVRRIRDRGVTVLLIEHDMGFVMGLCDRVLVVETGRRLAEGLPDEVRRDKRVIEAYLGVDEDAAEADQSAAVAATPGGTS